MNIHKSHDEYDVGAESICDEYFIYAQVHDA